MKRPFVKLIFAVMISTTGQLQAQEDSIKIQQINVHIIENGKQTASYFTRNQKTLTMDEKLIREINFDDSTKQIRDYTFYFYRNDLLYTEENYDAQDSLQWIIRHIYNNTGQETEKARLLMAGGKLMQEAKILYTYDINGNLLSEKDFGTGKKPYKTTSFEYKSGKLVKEQSRIRKSPDNVILRTADYQYAAYGKLKIKIVIEKSKDKSINSFTESYFYNDQGNLEKIEIRDKDGEISLVKHYVYYPVGGLYRYYEQNKEGNMLCYYTYAYRKYRINLGTQKSYFDKP